MRDMLADTTTQLARAGATIRARGGDGFRFTAMSPCDESVMLLVQFSLGMGWEHASVTAWFAENQQHTGRCPLWEEMCFVKNLLWNENEWVAQYHPSKRDYVNCHPYCLHLWRPKRGLKQKPDAIMVGPKSATE